MVQNATPTPKRLGRTPAFDRADVVEKAIPVFWAKGFADTTLTDLEHATGVNRSTLYNSFDGKDGLYRSATTAYVAYAEAELFEPLYHGTNGIADIVEFLDRLGDKFDSGTNPRGCLIVNDMTAAIHDDVTDRYLQSLQEGLRAALERASASGETDLAKAPQRCQFLFAAVLGINLVNRRVTDPTATQSLINDVRSEINTWATPN